MHDQLIAHLERGVGLVVGPEFFDLGSHVVFQPMPSGCRTLTRVDAWRREPPEGVLCSRERLEAIVRKKPSRVKDLEDVPGLRRWQIAEMGEEFVQALGG